MTGIDKRLQTISEMIIPREPVADIGTDHAYLPIYLVENNIVPYAIASDLPDGPYARALNAAKNCLYPDRIEIRQGDGLKVLKPAEVSSVIIAGMGGDTISQILSFNWEKSESYKRFVFQPMSRPEVLRNILAHRGWPVIDEKMVYANNKFFVFISTRPGNKPYYLSRLQIEIGPVLLKDEYPGKREFLEYYLRKYQSIYNNLTNSNRMDKQEILQNYQILIHGLEEILNG